VVATNPIYTSTIKCVFLFEMLDTQSLKSRVMHRWIYMGRTSPNGGPGDRGKDGSYIQDRGWRIRMDVLRQGVACTAHGCTVVKSNVLLLGSHFNCQGPHSLTLLTCNVCFHTNLGIDQLSCGKRCKDCCCTCRPARHYKPGKAHPKSSAAHHMQKH
jgi:hypothetical protein